MPPREREQMDTRMKYALGFGLIIIICAAAFVLNPGSEFGGADGRGGDKIAEIDSDYEPWASNIWEPPAETQSLLFALQAAIGAVIIGYFIGNEHGKKAALRSSGMLSAAQAKAKKQENSDNKTENA